MIIDSPIISGSYAASGSLNQFGDITITGSLTVTGNIIGSVTGSVDSASFATVAGNAQLLDNKDSTEFAVTSSNTFTGKQRITDTTNPTTFISTASLYTDGGLRVTKDTYISGSTFIAGNLTVFGTSSVEYVTSSTFIGLEYIDLNTDSPALRYAGIRVYDSGSPSESTSSLLWDSQNNKWIYSNPSTVGYSGGMLISGPRNTGSLGSEQGTTNNALMKGQGGDHITSSQVMDDGTTVSIPGNLDVTGSIIGSLTGTATTASYWSGSILNATSASFASTASFALNVPLTSSFALTASYWSGSIATASFALTASYATNAGAGAGFPFSGSAIITGSLQVTNLTGSGTAYLVADSTGSILRQNASAALRNTQAFTSSANQTTFAVTNGYTTGYVDVFINGTKLSAGEFTDTSGTNIVLTTGSFSGDIVEVVKYLPADGVSTNVLRTQTNFIATAGQTVFSASYAPGLLDIFYNGSRLSFTEYTANNGTFFTLATASNAGDVLDVFNYSYKIGGFTGIGGSGGTNQLSYFSTTSSITGSPNLTFNGSTLAVTGGFAVFTGSAAEFQVNATGVRLGNAITDTHTVTGSLSMSGSFSTVGTITAQTLVVQTVTSSTVYSSGSNIFGNNIANTHIFTGSVLLSSGSVLNVGRTDNGYPFAVSSQFAKTDTTGRGLMFLGSNEAIASNPFGLVVTVTGASTLSSRMITIGTTDFGLANGGILNIQGVYFTGSNVGIGTSIPLTILDVKQTATGTATVNSAFRDSSTNGNALQIWNGNSEARFRAIYYGTPSDQNITFYTITSAGSEGERMRITSGGNVGIATNTIPNNLGTALQIGPTVNFMSYIGNAYFLNNWYYDSSGNAKYITSNFASGITQNGSGELRFFTNPSGTANATFTPAERLIITNGGNVGIGNINPRTRLQVTPQSNAETPVLGTATGAVTFTSANTNYGIQFNSTSDGSYFIQSQRFDSSATAYPLGLNPVGSYVWLGKGWGASNHRINLEVAQGNNILVISGYSGASNDSVIIKAASGANPNATTTVMEVTTNSATGRSISAGGTINGSGTDYAEYMTKATTDVIAKGDIVGINTECKLTNIFADAVSFVVKSTNPSYVGGDAWGNEEAMGGKRPERTIDQTEEEFAPILAEFEARLEIERVKVDRIAFSGQVPCNITGANVGDYIIPIELENGKIGGQAVTNPTFEQYQISVGKVWKIMEDGRAWIAVKIG
jgi:hypothetical protein